MKQQLLALVLAVAFFPLTTIAQDEEEEKKIGFNKENLFTGGSVTLSFFNGQTVLGANPIFGYKLTNWLDAGVAFNVQYATSRDNYSFDDRIKQTIVGPGVFARIYPVNMIFLQGQFERNFIKAKYIYPGGSPVEEAKESVNSFLVGGGLARGRERGGTTFYYISVLLDVIKDVNSPYTRVSINPDNPAQSRVDMAPIIRAGINIGLFQGGNRRGR
jgi:hypothetical protein